MVRESPEEVLGRVVHCLRSHTKTVGVLVPEQKQRLCSRNARRALKRLYERRRLTRRQVLAACTGPWRSGTRKTTLVADLVADLVA
jgi:hypothetical protein